MSVLWFIGVIVLLILWLREKSKSSSVKDDAYKSGLVDGYDMAKSQVKAVRESNNDDTKTLDQFIAAGQSAEDGGYRSGQSAEAYQGLPRVTTDTASTTTVTPAVYSMSQSAISQPYSGRLKLDPEEVERQKTRQTLKNLNMILYVASFLIVAATTLFVTLTMPAAAKLTSLIVVTALFYGVGLALYDRSVRLRPAAVAFVGTGLAILPFIGFALTAFSDMSNQLAWLATSLIGLAAYTVAAVRLKSQLVSYITMAFVLSLALSAVSILSLAVMWYFIVIIGISLLFNCLYILAPKSLPELFSKPVRDTGLATTPVALFASLLAMQSMDLWMYIILFAVATVHYLVVWVIQRNIIHEITVRILAHATLLLLVVDIVKDMGRGGIVIFGLSWLVLLTLQTLYSLLRIRYGKVDNNAREMICIGLVVSLMLIILPLWLLSDLPSHWIAANLALVGVVCAGLAYQLRQIGWLYSTLVVSVLLPFIFGRQVLEASLPYGVIAGLFLSLGLIGLVVLERAVASGKFTSLRLFLEVSVVTYAFTLVTCGLLAADSTVLGWAMASAAGMMVALSYLSKQSALEVIGAVFAVVAIFTWVSDLLIASQWQLIASVVTSSLALAIGAAVHHKFQEYQRRNSLIIIGASVFAGLVLEAFSYSQPTMRGAALLLLVAGIGALVARALLKTRGKNRLLSAVSKVVYILYPCLALVLGLVLGGGWLVLVSLAVAGLAWAGSYLEKRDWWVMIGNLFFVIAVTVLWLWLEFSGAWAFYGVTWISAAAFYLMYWYSHSRLDTARMQLSFGSVLAMLVVASVYGWAVVTNQASMASAGSVLMLSGVIFIHGYLRRDDNLLETALYAMTLGLQWLVSVMLPEVGAIVYGHWWAITIALAAMWRNSYKTRVIIALSLVTALSGLYALTRGDSYSLFFLSEHLIMAIAGVMLRKQWAMWWGIIAVVLAVLYFLRGYTFMALLFLGLVLILFVVWRLIKLGDKK